MLSRLRRRGWTFNTRRDHLERFAKEAAASVGADAVVLDAGAGECPYAPLFAHARYETADVCKREKSYGTINYLCDLRSIPVDDGRFDLVLFTQVLEHVSEPQEVLRELHRVLKPGGRLWLSAPLSFDEHEIPYDFYRFTRYGLRHLLEKAGFRIVRLEWLEGYLGTVAYQLHLAARKLPGRPAGYGGGVGGTAVCALVWCVRPLLAVIAFLFARLDVRHKVTTGGHCLNYAVVAEKPQAS